MNWYQKRFIVERKCTCARSQLSAECVAPGAKYHAVDGHDDLGAALADARACAEKQWGKYRVVESKTGEVVGEPMDFRPVQVKS